MRDEAGKVALDLLPAMRRTAPRGGLTVSEHVVFEALALGAAGGTPDEVAHGLLAPLLRDERVRAGALVLGSRGSSGPRVVASVGYDCGTFEPGTVLPPDAGLPVTRAARTGRTVVQGTGPSWAAVPVAPGGALLLSLLGPPPSGADLARLERLAAAAGPALARARGELGRREELALLEHGLARHTGADPSSCDVAVRLLPLDGRLGGDVVGQWRDGAVTWLVVADVSGRGPAAAPAALRLSAAFRALAPRSPGPAALLEDLQRAVVGGEEEFVTALVLRLDPAGSTMASAGHPGPLLLCAGHVLAPDLLPGVPLGLAVGGPTAHDAPLDMPAGCLLVAHTDGLVDRHTEVDLPRALAALGSAADPTTPTGAVADALLAAADLAGPAQDDISLVVVRAPVDPSATP